MSFLRKNIGTIIVIALIIGIGTCNYRLNTSTQNNIITNPKPGDYFVFKDYPAGIEESIMKVKEVLENEIVFYLPHGEIMGGFELNKSENTVRNADENGQLYGTETITIAKSDIVNMAKNKSFLGTRNNSPRIEHAF